MGSLSTSILANEFNTGILNDILCSDVDQAITLNIDNVKCLPDKCIPQTTGAMKFKINNARLSSYSLSTDIGGNALAELTYSFPDGSRYKGLLALLMNLQNPWKRPTLGFWHLELPLLLSTGFRTLLRI